MSIIQRILGAKRPAEPADEVAAIAGKVAEFEARRADLEASLPDLEEAVAEADVEAMIESTPTSRKARDAAEVALNDARRDIRVIDLALDKIAPDLADARARAEAAQREAQKAAEREDAQRMLKSLPKLEARAQAALAEVHAVAHELNAIGAGMAWFSAVRGNEAEFEIPDHVRADLGRKANPPAPRERKAVEPAPVINTEPLQFWDSEERVWRDNPKAVRPAKVQIVRGVGDAEFDRLGGAFA